MNRRKNTESTQLFDGWQTVDGLCAVPGCLAPGVYPAPRSRQQLGDRLWFCLGHVREFNAAWDFYAGMNMAEIEAHLRADTTWRRPTWPFGTGARQRGGEPYLRDDFGVFDEPSAGAGGANGTTNGGKGNSTEEQRALAAMDLSPPVSADALRRRYKELVKRLHPDANGGDKQAEERLKSINQAYATLKNSEIVDRPSGQ